MQYSTVTFICQIYGVPKPTITWYKVNERTRSSVEREDLQLVLVNSESYA